MSNYSSSRPLIRCLSLCVSWVLIFSTIAPSTLGAMMVRDLYNQSIDASKNNWLVPRLFNKTPSSQEPFNRGIKPSPPESKAEKESRLARLDVNPGGHVILQSQQPMWFTAIPFDASGSPIHGLPAEWESSDKQVLFIRKSGQALAGKPGSAIVTARAGSLAATVRITVNKGNGQRFGGRKQRDSIRQSPRASQTATAPADSLITSNTVGSKKHHAETALNKLTSPPPVPMRDPSEDPLPDNETSSLYQSANAIGSPPGKKRAGAPVPAAAIVTSENGNKNFSFALPLAGLPGRGLDASVSLVYNSNVWHKSTDSSSSTWMTYDVDSSWPATGWRITLGQIEDQGSAGFTLTDMDGTRRALVYTSANNYDTADGSFIHYYGGGSWGVLYYPDGTTAFYGAGGGGYRLYPTYIVDRNGNYITINYAGTNGAGPKISSICDTLGRYISFYYASNGDLVAITQPGLGTSDVQTTRFYYTDVTLGSSLFGSGINVSGPSSVHTLQYVYLPTSSESSGAHTGYKFDYSTYGMVRQITEYRGMTVSSSSTSSAGSVTSEGTWAAQTTYNYPTSGQSFTDVPTYPTRTDDWQGRTTNMSGGAPYYTFSTNESTGVSTVTAPDGTISETNSIVNAGQWNHGLVSDAYIKTSTTTLARTHMDWEQDSNSRNPRVYQTITTDVPAGLSKATVLTYSSYNNITVVSERNFGSSETTPSSTELRRIETTYVTSSSYVNRHLLHLMSSVKVYPGGSSTAAARVDYAYDDYGTSHVNMTSRDDIIMHDPAFDPFQETQESCDWVCREYDPWWVNCIDWQWECSYYNPYDSATDYRGNVTSVTTYADAATPSGAITHATTYDIAGNVVSAQVDCCQTKTLSYTDSPNTHTYAYPTSVTSGNPSGLHTTRAATYSFNTGLVATTTDENGQTTSNSYSGDSLRLTQVDSPGGGLTSLTYSDGLSADGSGNYHSYVKTSVRLDNNGSGGATRYVDSYSYFDGRGALARTLNNYTSANGWSTQDTEYDTMGRAYRVSNPYYSSGYSAAVNSEGFWTTRSFDNLGRIYQVTMPRGDNNNSLTTSISVSFDGAYTTVTDQANKTRRQKVDALGRMIRIDEPTTSGLGSTTQPNQATDYYYDVLNNVVRVTQGSQDRYFKYDSLSRLIRERQVEQTPNSNYNLSDSLTGNSSWTYKLEYNSSGRVTNAYDARGVQTSFSYDDLNRVTQISYSDSTPTAHYYYDSQTLPSGSPSTSSPDSYSRGYSTGRLVAMTYGSGATGTYLGYDAAGRVVQQFQLTGSTPAKYKLSYSYNYADFLTTETYPSGRALTYSFDEGGRLSSVGDGTTTFAQTFAFAADGGLASETWGNGAVHAIGYNRRLQASQVKLTHNSTVQQQYDYSYGQFNTSSGAVDSSKNNGQIGRVDGTIGTTPQWNQGFSYDELGRLVNTTEHSGNGMTTTNYSQSYTYDRFANRFQTANSTLGLPGVSSSEINAATNRFINSGSTPATYDQAGNITQDTKFRRLEYSYDANGRMTSADSSDNDGYQNAVYDCTGQRVQTTSNAGTRTMVYDVFGQLVADYTGSSGSTLERENIYRGEQLLAVYEAAASCYMSVSDFVDAFYQGTLGRSYNASSDPDWKTTLRQAQSQGISQLVIAAQNLGASLFTSTEYANRNRTNAQFVTDLYAGYLQRAPDTGGYDYWMAALNNGSTRDQVRFGFAYSTEFQNNVSRLCTSTSSTSASIRYVLTDLQGTTRAVMNNNGSSSAVISRHDYLPFGEQLWAGIGSRSSSQAYGNTDGNRQKYGMTERDEATGLDHTWWRKYESLSGRWTSPDPAQRLGPQSMNAYTYSANDPVNFIDPSGLLPCEPGNYSAECGYGGFGGWGGGFDMNARVSPFESSGRQTIIEAEHDHDYRYHNELWGPFRFRSAFVMPDPFLGFSQDIRKIKEVTDCDLFASEVARIAFRHPISYGRFANALRDRFASGSEANPSTEFGSTGFKPQFRDDVGPGNSPNQVRHYVGGFRAALFGGRLGGAYATWRERGGTASNLADLRLNVVSRAHAFAIQGGAASHEDLANMIRRDVCDPTR